MGLSDGKRGKKKIPKWVLVLISLFSSGTVALVPLILTLVITVSSLAAGIAGLLWILNKEDPTEQSKSDQCTCEFLSQAEIDILNSGGSITLPDGSTQSGGVQPGPGTGNGSANITGSVVAGDFPNDVFWFLKSTVEQYGDGMPLWFIYLVSRSEMSGALTSTNAPFKEGVYVSLDSSITNRPNYLRGFRQSNGKLTAAAGIFQIEDTNTGVLQKIDPVLSDVTNFYASIGIDVTKYPGMTPGTLEASKGWSTWDKDPLYIPAATYAFIATCKERVKLVDDKGLMDFPEFAELKDGQKNFVRLLLASTSWNNGPGSWGGRYQSAYTDPIVRKYFAALTKICSDPTDLADFTNNAPSCGGNANPACRDWVIDKAISLGYMTPDDKTHIKSIPYDGPKDNGYGAKELRHREMKYTTNGLHQILKNTIPELASHGVTVTDWGLMGGNMSSSGTPTNSTGNTTTRTPSTPTTSTNTSTTAMKLKYTKDNMDGGDVKAEYEITSCTPLKVKDMPVNLSNPAYPKSMAAMNGLVVHFNSGPSSVEGIHGWFENLGNSASQFDIDNTGTVAMFLPLDQYAICSNAENGKKIGIEVANKSLDDPQYSAAGYESLVHLTAYLAVELNFDLDFNFIPEASGNPYRDTGTVMRHYDVNSSGSHYAKGCPAYWCPADGSVSNANSNNQIPNAGGHAITITSGGNTRWISFKTEVIKYILNFKDDPNFKVTLEDGSELHGLDWARQNSAGTFNWRAPELKNITAIEGDGTGFTSPLTGGTGSGGSGSTTVYGKGARAYTTACAMDTKGYCGCYRGDSKCKCGCGGTSDAPYIGEGTPGIPGTPGSTQQNGPVNGSTAPQYDGNNGLAVPATRQYTMADVKSTGGQRVVDTALVTFQQMYIEGSKNLGKIPLYTQNRNIPRGYNYAGLSQHGFTTASGQKIQGRFDCSSFVGAVLSNMGYTILNMPSTETLFNADLSSIGFTKTPFNVNDLQPGDIVVKSGKHAEVFVGWKDEASKVAYVYSWGGSQRLSDYTDGHGRRGSANGDNYVVSGAPGANNNTPGALITGPTVKTYDAGKFDITFRTTN